MSRLGHAAVGEDDVNSYQVYKYFWSEKGKNFPGKHVQIIERRTQCITDAERGDATAAQPTIVGEADAACTLYVYSHCSCREAVQVLMIANEKAAGVHGIDEAPCDNWLYTLVSAGQSLNEPPSPNYNNWPSIFRRPFLSRHLTEQQPSYICTRPENFTHT